MPTDGSQHSDDGTNSFHASASPSPTRLAEAEPTETDAESAIPGNRKHPYQSRPEANETQPLLTNSQSITTNGSTEIRITDDVGLQGDIVKGQIWAHIPEELRWLIRIASPIVAATVLNMSLGIVGRCFWFEERVLFGQIRRGKLLTKWILSIHIGTFMLGHLGTWLLV